MTRSYADYFAVRGTPIYVKMHVTGIGDMPQQALKNISYVYVAQLFASKNTRTRASGDG